MKKGDQWTEQLRNRLKGYEEEAPEGLWDDLEQALGQVAEKPCPVRWYRRPVCRFGAVAAMVMVLFAVGYYWVSVSALGDAAQDAVDMRQPVALAVEPPRPGGEGVMPDRLPLAVPGDKGPVAAVGEVQPLSEPVDQEDEPEHVVKEVVPELIAEKTPVKQVREDTKEPVREAHWDDTGILSGQPDRHHESGWSAGMYATNLPGGKSADRYAGYGVLRGNMLIASSGESASKLDQVYAEILTQNVHREVETRYKHRQPLTLGATFSYRLNRRWAVGTGLTYTLLSSDLESGSESNYYKSEQRLHYVGIPLNVTYSLWRNRVFTCYLSAGVEAALCVDGTLETDYVVNNESKEHNREHVRVSQLQWSLHAAGGVEAKLWRNWGVYAEPGVGYYIKDGSDLQTFYKDKPLNFSLQFGLRYTY